MSESTYNHTPRAVDGNNAVAEDVNQPLRQLDFAIGLHNLTATANPTTAANSAAGYTTGRSLWFNTSNGTWWLCTNAAAGTWQQVAVGSSIGSHTHAAADIISGLLALARGGSGADLSATGPGVVVQESLGAALAARALVAGDLPAASTTAQGAVELATPTETVAGTDATRAVTPAGLAQVLVDVPLDSTFIAQSTGVPDAGRKIRLDSTGKIDLTMIDYNDVLAILLTQMSSQGDILVRNNTGGLQRRTVGGQGQVLSVDLTHPTGLAYVSPITSGSGIPVSLIDQKGDLVVGSAADTVVRLPVGASGRVLAAQSSAPEGVAWVDGATLQVIGEVTSGSLPLTIAVSSTIFSSYKKLLLTLNGQFTGGGNAEFDFYIQLNDTSETYSWNSSFNNGSTVAASQTLSGTYIPMLIDYNTEGARDVSMDLEFFLNDYFSGDLVGYRGQIEVPTASAFTVRHVAGRYNDTELTAINLVSSDAGMTFTGSMRLMGIK